MSTISHEDTQPSPPTETAAQALATQPSAPPSPDAPSGEELAAVRQRLIDIMELDDPTDALWEAQDDGFFEQWVPEIPALGMEQDSIHRHKDVLTHTFIVTANTSPQFVLRMGALFHDIGKPATRKYEGKKVTFYHHEYVGAKITRRRLKALGFDKQTVLDIARLVELSGRFHGYQAGWADSAVRRYARDAGPLLADLNELVRCDCTTRHPEKLQGLQRRMDDLEDRIRDLAKADAEARVRPDLDGADVMELLNLEPGQEVGEALKMLLAHKKEHGPLEREDAIALLHDWWASRT